MDKKLQKQVTSMLMKYGAEDVAEALQHACWDIEETAYGATIDDAHHRRKNSEYCRYWRILAHYWGDAPANAKAYVEAHPR